MIGGFSVPLFGLLGPLTRRAPVRPTVAVERRERATGEITHVRIDGTLYEPVVDTAEAEADCLVGKTSQALLDSLNLEQRKLFMDFESASIGLTIEMMRQDLLRFGGFLMDHGLEREWLIFFVENRARWLSDEEPYRAGDEMRFLRGELS